MVLHHKFETAEEYTGPIACRLEYNAEYFESDGICEEFANKFGEYSLDDLSEVAMQLVHEICFLSHGWYGAERRVVLKTGREGQEHFFYGDGKDFHEALFVALAALNATNPVYTKEEFHAYLEDIRRQLSQVQNDPNLVIVTHHELMVV